MQVLQRGKGVMMKKKVKKLQVERKRLLQKHQPLKQGEPREKKRRGMTSFTLRVKPAADGKKDDRKVTGAAVAEALEAVGKHTFSVGFEPGRERR